MSGVIAGNPRSGTSLTMNISAEAVGIDRIIGEKFGRIDRLEQSKYQWEDESDEAYAMRQYILAGLPENSKEAMEHYAKMNPNGFYEHGQFTVRGIRYLPFLVDDMKMLDEEDKDNPYIIKLVNSGLAKSDPKYIDWVIYLVRHPWDVAKSQENLIRNMKFTLANGKKVDLFDGIKFNDPDFYIRSTIMFAEWKMNHPEIPVLFVEFDNLISDPETELKRMTDFTGENYMKGLGIIDPKLGKRHNVERDKREGIWEDALHIHNLFSAGDFEGILDFAKDKTSWFSKNNMGWFCPRTKGGKSYANCHFCLHKEDEQFIKSAIEYAEANEIDWRDEPCPFECGFDPEDKHPYSIEESVKKNHWLKYENKFSAVI